MRTGLAKGLPTALALGFALLWALAALPAVASETHAPAGGENSLFAGDLGNAVWTLVVFGLVVFLLGKYAWGPILTRLQEREGFIRDSLSQAKADRLAAEAQLKAYEDKLAHARAEATKIVEEGRRDAEAVKARIELTAREESDRMIARAKREIDLARDTAVKDLYTMAGRLATDAASRIIRKELKGEDHERLIAEAIANLEAAPQGRSGTGGYGAH
jgi:F-type H+-transporting ATPase subunit b